jgi:hypothetical protein
MSVLLILAGNDSFVSLVGLLNSPEKNQSSQNNMSHFETFNTPL